MSLLAYDSGRFVAQQALTLPFSLDGPGLGAGFQATARVYEGIPFRLDRHLDRLERALRFVGAQGMPDRATVQSAAGELIARNRGFPIDTLTLAAVLTAQPQPPHVLRARLVMLVNTESIVGEAAWESGVRVVAAATPRAGPGTLARQRPLGAFERELLLRQAEAAAARDALLFDADDALLESARANVFVVQGERVLTPSEENALYAGVTRAEVLDLCRKHDITCVEAPISRPELLQADEVFLTSAAVEVLPVLRVEYAAIGDGQVGPITRRVHRVFRNRVREAVRQATEAPAILALLFLALLTSAPGLRAQDIPTDQPPPLDAARRAQADEWLRRFRHPETSAEDKVHWLERLADLNHPDLAADLRQGLADESPEVRRATLRAMLALGNPLVFEDAMPATEDEVAQVRAQAVRTLAGLGGDRAVEALLARLGDHSSKVRQEAITGLRNHTWHSFGYDPEAGEEPRRQAARLLEDWWRRDREVGHSELERLRDALETQPPSDRTRALREIQARIARDGDGAFTADERQVVLDACLSRLDDVNGPVRREAALTLRLLTGQDFGYDPDDDSPSRRRKAREAWVAWRQAEIERGRPASRLEQAEDPAANAKTKLAALRELATHDAWDQVERVLPFLTDPATTVRLQAQKTLTAITDYAVFGPEADLSLPNPALWRRVAEEYRSWWVNNHNRARLDRLLVLLVDDAPGRRTHAARMLGRLGDVRAVDPLLRKLSDEKSATRAAAALALGELGDPTAAHALIERADNEREDPGVRMAAYQGLEKLAHESFGPFNPMSAAKEAWRRDQESLTRARAFARKQRSR